MMTRGRNQIRNPVPPPGLSGMADSTDPREFLPLRPIEFEILLVLMAGDSHGYAIIKEAEERWPGSDRLETGTLYRALRRLAKVRMVEPAERRAAGNGEDERRRYFTITPFGKSVAAAEARRLEAQVDVARARELLSGAGGSAR
jgi:DNA-binding PadR family transcriptional regulator